MEVGFLPLSQAGIRRAVWEGGGTGWQEGRETAHLRLWVSAEGKQGWQYSYSHSKWQQETQNWGQEGR